ncbi:MAG: M42 family metallopeptidase, partial [Candidatus Thermoplasmatota archaeon]|nr:M42 family metallopeptidase [Candidatus Thermoplasmatota archaeon]
GPEVALVAHMDEIGMVVSNIEDNGYLRIKKIGGVLDPLLTGRHVKIHTNQGPINGVIGHKPPHLTTEKDDKDEVTPWTKTHVDVGADSAEEVREMGIDVPDPITFDKKLRRLGKNVISGRGLDNRIGSFALLEVLKKLKDQELEVNLSSIWSVQEEIGLRGAKVVANTRNPEYVIALDTYTTSDAPGVEEFYKPIKFGEGPVLRMVDTRAISSPKLVDHFKDVAEESDIPYQYGVTGGTTDGMALQESGCLTLSIGVPVKYSHSTVECADWRDVRNLIELITEGIQELP